MDWSYIISEIKRIKGLSTAELAEKSKVTSRYISDLERGSSNNPTSKFLSALVNFVEVDPGWLLTGEGDPFKRDDFTPKANHCDYKQEEHFIINSVRQSFKELIDSNIHEAMGLAVELHRLDSSDISSVVDYMRRLNIEYERKKGESDKSVG